MWPFGKSKGKEAVAEKDERQAADEERLTAEYQAREAAYQARKAAELAEFQQEMNLRIHYDTILSKVIFTPETIEEYQKRVGCVVEVIDTGEREKMIIFSANQFDFVGNDKVKKRLVEGGIEAILHANYITYSSYDRAWDHLYVSGLPVARKKGGSYS